MKSMPGTYALILRSEKRSRIQAGRWREIDVEPGYYIYVGSAFGPGGTRYAFTSYKDRCPVCCPDQAGDDDATDNHEQADEVNDDDD